MGEIQTIFEFMLAGYRIGITYSVVSQWIIMILIMVAVSIFTKNLKTIPRGSQVWIETIVEGINNLVKGTMGEEFKGYAPYIGTIMIYLLIMNFVGLVGLPPPTTDLSVTSALALISFVVIQGTAIKRIGIGHYFTGLAKPYAFLLPLNIIERLIVPLSLSIRLFGNITAAVIMMELLYEGLEYFSHSINLPIPLMQAIIPIPFHMYFDIFDGGIQMIIFTMLTMIFIKITSEH